MALEATKDAQGCSFKCQTIKASELIREWARRRGRQLPSMNGTWRSLDYQREMQDLGDEMRKSDHAAVAAAGVRAIAKARAEMMGMGDAYTPGQAVEPDSRPRAFILDSIKHPAEAMLFRKIYGNSFVLIAVVCDRSVRKERIRKRYFPEVRWHEPRVETEIDRFIERDGSDPDPEKRQGQHVTEVFHQADFFIDNTRHDPDGKQTESLNDQFGRLFDIVTHRRIRRPTIEETAMHVAASSQLSSACLSRQVGAALVDRNGNVVAVGTNSPPKPGGGVQSGDNLCQHKSGGSGCRSNEEQNRIIEEVRDLLPLEARDSIDVDKLRKTRLGGLLEFSRAVHAEMDAILSAARSGVSPLGCRLFVTAFPCHYCARHIVSAGIAEVHFIEPYPKSLAFDLHGDAIEGNPEIGRDGVADRSSMEKVLFRPFVGVAPTLYARAFQKDREYKDRATGRLHIGEPAWPGPWNLLALSYAEFEARLGVDAGDPSNELKHA